MEQPDHIPVEENLQRLTVMPCETEMKKEKQESYTTPQPKNHDKENRKEKDGAVDIMPEEEGKKKSVRQSDRSASSTSTCSSVNDSSPESDQVFSEEEEIQPKRKTLRKTKSWKTFFTMVHWSLKRQNSWVQLAGHEGNFKASERGHILKKFSPIENACLEALMQDILRPYVPTYHGLVEREDQTYIKMEDLLVGLEAPSIMDCKMGFRTYLEDELAKALLKPTPRKDLYNKMVALDPQAPTLEEHLQKAVTKPRYMQWRESVSSTAALGFRIEGVTIEAGSVKKNFKKMKSREKIMETFITFTKSRKDILAAYVTRLESMQAALKESKFFRTHEVIGSSLLFVHDRRGNSNVWMIDFGKTTPAPAHISLRHDVAWKPGTHEDGYLLGLQNLIDALQDTIQIVEESKEEAGDGSVQVEEQSIGENEKTEVNAKNGENNTVLVEDDALMGTPTLPENRIL